MIRFANVTKRYPGGHEALKNVSFTLAAGELAFLTGRSGAGKSTLLKLIAALERPTQGQVHVQGQALANLPRHKIPTLRRSLGVIFQSPRLLTGRTVYENVALPLVVSGVMNSAEIGRRVRAALDKVGLLNKERVLPPTLSGGEQQRVAIARALVHRPALIVADEPTGNLDPALAEDIMQLFLQFQQVGTTLLIASHNVELIARFHKRLLHLEEGRLMTTDRVA